MDVDQLKQVYTGKKVFVTGHTGFKGSWLLCMLNLLGARVKGYALAPGDGPSLFNQLEGDELCWSVISNILDKEKLKRELTDFQPDFIFHLAAQPLVRRSYEIPVETFEVNVIGTVNLLDCAKCLDKPCSIIVVTTDKVYENNERVYPYLETDRLGGFDPYSASKACAEIAVTSYRQSFFTGKMGHQKGLATARAGNVIGGGDWALDRIIPDIVRAFEKSQDVLIRNPASVRPWQHVLEPLTGYLCLGARLAAEPGCFSEAFNFGPPPSETLNVEDMVKMAIAIWGTGKYHITSRAGQLHEAGNLQLDISKAANLLGWSPALSIRGALELTISWYKQYLTRSPAEITFEQIGRYWDLLK